MGLAIVLNEFFLFYACMLADDAISLHAKLRGKIGIEPRIELTKDNLKLLYTPGAAFACQAVAKNKDLVFEYTSRWNNVAIVTDGTRVLGLGRIGPEAALPLMEGKALIFKALGGVNAFPLCLNTKSVDEIVSVIKAVAPSFGGINLEDISSPECFEVEERLTGLGIPVFHDDQHGTAIVALAALENALKVVGKDKADSSVVILGAGAAGIGMAKLFSGFKDIVLLDSEGALYAGRNCMNRFKEKIAKKTNKTKKKGSLSDVISGADVLITVSGKANCLDVNVVKEMAEKPIVFALTNPVPEFDVLQAEKLGALVAAGSNFKNQVNNSLAFPGVFRGALDARAKEITLEMNLTAAKAISSLVKNPSRDNIVPLTTDSRLLKEVSEAVKKTALAGVQLK